MKTLLFCLLGVLIGCGGSKENLPVTIDLSVPASAPSAQLSAAPMTQAAPEVQSPKSGRGVPRCDIKLVCNVNDPDAPIGYVMYTSEEGERVERRLIIDYGSPKHSELTNLVRTQGVGLRGPQDPYRSVCLQTPLGLLLPPSP